MCSGRGIGTGAAIPYFSDLLLAKIAQNAGRPADALAAVDAYVRGGGRSLEALECRLKALVALDRTDEAVPLGETPSLR